MYSKEELKADIIASDTFLFFFFLMYISKLNTQVSIICLAFGVLFV